MYFKKTEKMLTLFNEVFQVRLGVMCFCLRVPGEYGKQVWFGEPEDSPAPGALVAKPRFWFAAAHPAVGIEFLSSEMSCPFLWSLYLNINWSQKSFIVLVVRVGTSTFSSALRKSSFRFQLVYTLVCKAANGN